jgi:hypothetical protein
VAALRQVHRSRVPEGLELGPHKASLVDVGHMTLEPEIMIQSHRKVGSYVQMYWWGRVSRLSGSLSLCSVVAFHVNRLANVAGRGMEHN